MTEPKRRALVAAMKHGGTHYTRSLFGQLGIPRIDSHRLTDDIDPAWIYVVKRDPRARLVSRFRWTMGNNESKARTLRRRFETDEERLAFLCSYAEHGDTPVSIATAWAHRHLEAPGAEIIDFDDMMNSPEAVAYWLREHVSPGEVRAAHARINGKGHRYSGRHTVWQEWFTPMVQDAWTAAGGDEVVELFGYSK